MPSGGGGWHPYTPTSVFEGLGQPLEIGLHIDSQAEKSSSHYGREEGNIAKMLRPQFAEQRAAYAENVPKYVSEVDQAMELHSGK